VSLFFRADFIKIFSRVALWQKKIAKRLFNISMKLRNSTWLSVSRDHSSVSTRYFKGLEFHRAFSGVFIPRCAVQYLDDFLSLVFKKYRKNCKKMYGVSCMRQRPTFFPQNHMHHPLSLGIRLTGLIRF